MEIYKLLNIPKFTSQSIPLKLIIENAGLDKQQEKNLRNTIGRVSLYSAITPDNMHIRSLYNDEYSYQTIYIIKSELKDLSNLVEASHMIQSAFVEPVILFLNYVEKDYISMAFKRRNKVNSTKSVIEDEIVEELQLNDICITYFNEVKSDDLKEYYTNIINIVYQVRARHITGENLKGSIDYKKHLKEYEKTKTILNALREQYSKASMMKDKIQIDNQIFEYEQKQKQIIANLKGEN